MTDRLTIYLSSLDRLKPAIPEVLQHNVWQYLREAGTVRLLSETIEPPRRLEVSAQAGFWIKHFCVDDRDMSVLLTFRDGAGQSGVLYKYREGEGLERVSSEPVDAFCVNSVRGCVYAFRDQQLLRIRHRAPPYKVDHMWTLSPDWSPPDYMVSRGNHIVFGSSRWEAPMHSYGITVLTLVGSVVRVSSLDLCGDAKESMKFRRMLVDAFVDSNGELCILVCIGETLLYRSLSSDTWMSMKMRGQVRQMAMVQSSMIEDHFKEREETAPPLLAIVRHSSHNHTSDSEVFYLARLEIVDLNRGEVVVSVAWLQTPWCPNLAYVEHTIYFQACGPAIDKVDACLVYDAPFSKCKNMRKFS